MSLFQVIETGGITMLTMSDYLEFKIGNIDSKGLRYRIRFDAIRLSGLFHSDDWVGFIDHYGLELKTIYELRFV